MAANRVLILNDNRKIIRGNYKLTAMSISAACLAVRLRNVAIASLASANSGNPFISKSSAMRDINRVRKLVNGH